MILPGRDTFPTTANTTHTQCVLLVWRMQGYTQTTDSGVTIMDTAQAIIDALTTQAPGRMSLTELVYVTNRNRAEVCDYLDMLELDGVVTRGMRNAYPGHSDGPAYQVWSMTTDQIEATFDNVVA